MTLNPNSAWQKLSRLPACSWLLVFAFHIPNCFGFQTNGSAHSSSSPWGIESLVYEPTDSGNQPYKALGATSCSASACHGGPGAGVSSPQAVRGSEYPLWVESDPHAKSWRTLNSEKSVDILRRLRILVDGAIVNKPAYQNCLACHNTTKELQVDGISPRLAEGVGCESCHGPSELWRDSHYQGSFSVSESIEKRGLVNSKSEIVRAKTCTLCHVGGPDRDMNHDIIAAGHPALYFDYGTYLKAYPKHWRENAADPVKQSLERWLIGQVAKADSELELLNSRIRKTHPHSTWPEFSNYQCTSCHQNITGKTLIQLQDPSQNPQRSSIGQASVRMWNLEGLQTTDSLFGFDRKSTDELIQSLETAGSRRGDAEADRKPILEMIQKKRADLLGDPGSYSLEDLQQRLVHWPLEQQRTLVRRKWQAASESLNWEQAALAYLALHSSLPAPDDKKPLDRMRTRLIFPESTQSPGFLLPNSPSEAQAELQSHSWKSDSSLILESLGP
ncbi:MAG: hypothetical protein RLZZ396_823 [Planctomycetota bacterium]